jgi:acyl-CoA synthetase (AMP-forming)/AMP-acid ligase II
VPDSTLWPELTLPDPQQLRTLQHSGGTTGAAKAVGLTHAAVAINMASREALLPAQTQTPAITSPCQVYAVSTGLYLSGKCAGTLCIMPKFSAADIPFLSNSLTTFQVLLRDADFAVTDLAPVPAYNLLAGLWLPGRVGGNEAVSF